MNCPKCGSGNLHSASEVNTTTDYQGYGCCKGLVGFIIFGPIGWLCGLCGMGKGRTYSRTRTFWMCNNCGNKFR